MDRDREDQPIHTKQQHGTSSAFADRDRLNPLTQD
jgi:hypothetical protein